MRKGSKRIAYWIADQIFASTICDTNEKKALCDLLCDSLDDLQAVVHQVSLYMEYDTAEAFTNSYYQMVANEEKTLEPEVVASIIAGVVSLVTAGITYSCKQDVLRQCRSNMYFESSGGVWSTTSSQKFAGMLPNMLN